MTLLKATILQLIVNMLGARYRNWRKRPYMMERETLILEEFIVKKRPSRVLEWGCGFSTLYFSRFLQPESKWIAVEHDRNWATKIKSQLNAQNVEIACVHPSVYSDFSGSKGLFDLIIIDGIQRPECLIKSKDILSPEGIVFLHDANRSEYLPYLNTFSYQWVLTDYRRSAGGIAFLSNSDNLNQWLDWGRHQQAWTYFQNKAAKVLAI